MHYDYLSSDKSYSRIFKKLGVTFDEVAALPIEVLFLPQFIYGPISKKSKYTEAGRVREFVTLGDLVKKGKDPLYKILEEEYRFDYQKADEALLQIEEHLAKFALKLEGSDFTIYDIRVSSLCLPNNVLEFLSKFGKIETLGDIYVLGNSKLQNIAELYGYENELRKIRKVLKSYGTRPELNKVVMPTSKGSKEKFVGCFPSVVSAVECRREGKEFRPTGNDDSGSGSGSAGGSAGSGNPDAKFYFSKNGYLNMERVKVLNKNRANVSEVSGLEDGFWF